MRFMDLSGQRFGKLFVVRRTPHRGRMEWECLCDCGTVTTTSGGGLRSGKSITCGCGKSERQLRNIEGQVFGRLTIVSYAGAAANRVSLWNARCACGTTLVVRKSNLHNRNTLSCGCHRKDIQRARLTTHGKSLLENGPYQQEYVCWQSLFQRCNNKKNCRYADYGGRGIKVCERWKSFENFYADMGAIPDTGVRMSIERLDVDRGYEPANCVWLPLREQSKNQRPRRPMSDEHRAKLSAAAKARCAKRSIIEPIGSGG